MKVIMIGINIDIAIIYHNMQNEVDMHTRPALNFLWQPQEVATWNFTMASIWFNYI